MDVAEPRVRRRGFFFHVETPDLDAPEEDTAEGISVRLRVARPRVERSSLAAGRKAVTSAIRSTSSATRSENGTGSHQRARMSR
jgi:hypothetical protein